MTWIVSVQKLEVGRVGVHHLFRLYSLCCLQWYNSRFEKCCRCWVIRLTVLTMCSGYNLYFNRTSDYQWTYCNHCCKIYYFSIDDKTVFYKIIFVSASRRTWSWPTPLLEGSKRSRVAKASFDTNHRVFRCANLNWCFGWCYNEPYLQWHHMAI